MQELSATFSRYMENLYIPSLNAVTKTDIVEIIIITFMIYAVLVWVKETRAWALLRGVLVCAFLLVAFFTKMTTILWIAERLISLAVIAMVVILQPELRKALENLGQKSIVAGLFSLDMLKPPVSARFSDRTINEIVKACVEMGKVKTGALIVVEHKQPLTDYEKTGIDVDGLVSNQLLINIFEHNTPLHDGAVIVRGDRIIVSEETGKISVAYGGRLHRGLSADELREYLSEIQDKVVEEKKRIIWKGRVKNG